MNLKPWLRFLSPIVFLLLFYTFAFKLAHTLLFTIVAYLVTTSGKVGIDFSNTTNEIAAQYLFLSYTLGALLVTITAAFADKALYRHSYFWKSGNKPIWQLDRDTKEELIRGLSSGMIGAVVYLAVFLYAGHVSYLGVYITSTIGSPVFPLFFIDLVALFAFIVCEEFLFRHKILQHLAGYLSPTKANLLTSAIYVGIKTLQFQLFYLDYLNLFVLNLAIGYFYLKKEKIHRGLGFMTALLCLLHSMAGLPLWSHQSPSFFLFKHTQKASELLSGAGAGPFAGAGLFSILLFFTVSGYWQWKRSEKSASLS